jgi:hypothetical protein
MRSTYRLIAIGALCLAWLAGVQAAPGNSWRIALDSVKDLAPHGVRTSMVTRDGKPTLRVVEDPGFNGEGYVLVQGPSMQDGEIEVDLAGKPGSGAAEGARGFVGVAFRIRPDQSAFECFYLRPTNGRADDQLRRNHSTQYISFPEFPWERLRRDAPGVYESYVDLMPDEWAHMRIQVRGRRAALFVNRAPQPVLIVNDLKLAPAAGGVALWAGTGTEAHFRDLRVAAE